MSELPQGWALTTLANITDFNPKLQLDDSLEVGFVPMSHAPTNFRDKLRFDPRPWADVRKAYTHFADGDVIFAKVTPCFENGKAAVVSALPNGSGAGSSEFHVLRPASLDISSTYLLALVKSSSFMREGEAAMTGAVGLRRVPRGFVENFPVALPPAAEQARIANTLDSLLAQVDTLKARLDALPALIKRFRQSALNAAVSGNLSKDWRTQNPSLTADEMFKDFVPLPEPPRYKTRSDAFISGVCATAVGKPEHRIVPTWAWMPLIQIARMESGHTPSKAVQEYWGGEIPWIGIKDANANHEKTIYKTLNNTNQAGLDNSAARLLPAGTVCISRTASVGYVVKMGTLMSTSQDFVNWVPTDYIDPEWLKWLFVAEKESLYRFGKGTTHTTIYFPEWLSLHIAVPHIEEQRFIAQRTEQLLKYADGLSARVDDARVRVDALTQSILAKAFRGELVPQDPNDEPASVLLERIAAQRAAGPKLKRGRAAKSTS